MPRRDVNHIPYRVINITMDKRECPQRCARASLKLQHREHDCATNSQIAAGIIRGSFSGIFLHGVRLRNRQNNKLVRVIQNETRSQLHVPI